MRSRNHVAEPDKIDRGNLDRLALDDGYRYVDSVLLVVQFDVEAGDTGIRVSAVGVKRLNSLQVGVEPGSVEERLLSPGQLVALTCGERAAEPRRVHSLHALEIQGVDENRPPFP